MNEINICKSVWKGVRLILLSLPFLACGIFLLIKDPEGRLQAWLAIGFLGLPGLLAGLYIALDRTPEVTISEEGITYGRRKKDSLPGTISQI